MPQFNLSITDVFWAFLLITAMQPMMRQRLLEARRQWGIVRIERERGSRVILLVHRQETMRLLGFPLVRYIDVSDSEEVLRAVQLTDPDVPIDLVLQTPGGLALAALQIARALAARRAPVTVFVPHYAMSGGTLIALAATRIVMSPHAILGPIDPQIGEFPAASFLKVVGQKKPEDIDDETLIKADIAGKALQQMREAVTAFLGRDRDAKTAAEIAERLTDGHWTHDFPIFADTAAALGLAVSTQMPASVLDLMRHYPQPAGSGARTVEYREAPRHRDPAPGNILDHR